MFNEYIVAAIKFAALGVTTISGALGILFETRDKASGSLNKWGKIALILFLVSAFFAFGTQWIEWEQDHEKQSKDAKAANPLLDVSMRAFLVVGIDFPELKEFRQKLMDVAQRKQKGEIVQGMTDFRPFSLKGYAQEQKCYRLDFTSWDSDSTSTSSWFDIPQDQVSAIRLLAENCCPDLRFFKSPFAVESYRAATGPPPFLVFARQRGEANSIEHPEKYIVWFDTSTPCIFIEYPWESIPTESWIRPDSPTSFLDFIGAQAVVSLRSVESSDSDEGKLMARLNSKTELISLTLRAQTHELSLRAEKLTKGVTNSGAGFYVSPAISSNDDGMPTVK